MKRFHLILLITIGLLCSSVQRSAAAQDSIHVSLLTCSPGPEVYALFGHTAIRYENYTRGIDVVFNYGMFSFKKPNFVMRYLTGETDYELGITPFPYFELEYSERGSYVMQQPLNLTEAERGELVRLLEENCRPENRTYRYNYFYDNCTTRARDKIEEAVQGSVIYHELEAETTFRAIIHQYTAGHEWAELGIDLCLGSEADEPISTRLQMFAPFYMMRAAERASITDSAGVERPLVLATEKIIHPSAVMVDEEFPLTPMQSALLLLALTIIVGLAELKWRHCFWLMDILLFGLQGAAGCIIAFFFFFSVHPTMSSNYLVIILNPIPLLYLPVMIYRSVKHKKDDYHWANVVVLTLFMALWTIIPQKFNLVVLPLALSWLVRSVTHLLRMYRR